MLTTGAVLATLALPAAAHVEITPDTARKGSATVLSFVVPNERGDAGTVRLEATLPTDHPIASVSVLPLSGWTWTAETATLPKPIETDDGEITEAVSKVTWSGGEIQPGEFQLFTISAGPLPTNTKTLEFEVVQTYSDGETVRWIESTPKGGPEPEFPAPVLELVRKSKGR